MNSPFSLSLVGELIKLRYKLLWAKTRSRSGRIALFVVGYILLAMLLALLAAGGFASALVAVRAGRALAITQGAFSILFVQALIASNVLGFGINAIFSDAELRRYPLASADRRIARHLIGIIDPFWFLFFALELGLAIGLYDMGVASFWFGAPAVLLLMVANYVAARVVALLIDNLVKRRGGTGILTAIVVTLALGSSMIGPLIRRNPGIVQQAVAHFQFTPPFAAASAIVDSTSSSFAVIAAWIVGLAVVLIWLETRPPQRQSSESVAINWDSPWDRVARLFGPDMGPFVGQWLRFYGRNSRTRVQLVIGLVVGAFLMFNGSRQLGPNGLFIAALGVMPFAVYMGTSRIAVNQFGYSGGAFRRYFLLPVDASATLRAASYASLTLSVPAFVIALTAWIVVAPRPFDPRMLAMLACSTLTGLILFNALGIWVTLFNPRRGKYDSSFGNDLSLGGNILVLGGVITGIALPRLLRSGLPAAVSPDSWWMLLPLPLLAITCYLATLKAAGPVFTARREKLLAIVEGKS